MPIYEYHRQKCGQLEVTQRITESLGQMPDLQRQKSRSPILQLKGTGWYVTDYAQRVRMAIRKFGDLSLRRNRKQNEAKSETKSESEERALSSSSGSKPSSSSTLTWLQRPEPFQKYQGDQRWLPRRFCFYLGQFYLIGGQRQPGRILVFHSLGQTQLIRRFQMAQTMKISPIRMTRV